MKGKSFSLAVMLAVMLAIVKCNAAVGRFHEHDIPLKDIAIGGIENFAREVTFGESTANPMQFTTTTRKEHSGRLKFSVTAKLSS